MLINKEMMWLAEKTAASSPCIRRIYGAVIDDGNTYYAAYNARVGKCCSDDLCIRDRRKNFHGERVEQGGEIHAEQAVLLGWKFPVTGVTHFYLAGFDKHGNHLYGKNAWPCHACALMIKFAGFKSVIIRLENGDLEPVNISRIIEEQESEWDEPI